MQKYDQKNRHKRLEKPIRKIFKQIGYFNELDGIISRYNREGDNWRTHIENCKTFITQSLGSDHYRNITVLGSGWLLDVPVAQLSQQCDQLWLMDLRQPREVIHAYRQFENIVWLETDSTGGAIELLYQASLSKHPEDELTAAISRIETMSPIFSMEPDLLISINLMSQLDCIILEYLDKKFKQINSNLKVAISRALQQAHLNLLEKHHSLLITDISETVIKHKDKTVSQQSFMHIDLPIEKKCAGWDWIFDTRGYYIANSQTTLHVNAFKLQL